MCLHESNRAVYLATRIFRGSNFGRRSLSRLVAVLGLTTGLFAGGVQAQDNCMEDNWMAAGNTQGLTCTAKEVFIDEDSDGKKIIDVEIVDGCAYPGDTATVNITASIHFNSDRLDVGVYSAMDGGDAKTGLCAVDILDPNMPVDLVDGPSSTEIVGVTGSFDPMDNDDACGDADIFGGGGGNLDSFAFQTLTLACVDEDSDGFLDFSTCFSWRVDGSDDFCDGSQEDMYPGTPAKCFCETSNIEVPVPGRIIITKVTEPTPDPTNASFAFTLTGGKNTSGDELDESFELLDGESFDTAAELGPDMAPLEGTYNAAETVPSGWDLTSSTCDDGSSIDAIKLQPGETVTCTFTNKIKPGNIIVKKQTDPDGSTQQFTFTPSYNDGAAFQLADNEAKDSGDLIPGNYSVFEADLDGWEQTSATCDDDDGGDPANIVLDPGETVTCTFKNQQDANIIVVKETVPSASSQSFSFESNYGEDFQLVAGEFNDSGDLDPGTYAVSETLPDDWVQTSATCNNSDDPTAISLQAGETVTCTFKNKQLAKLTLEKIVVNNFGGPDSPTDFTLSAIGPDMFSGTGSVSKLVPDGNYVISEIQRDGYELTSLTCTNQGVINVDSASYNVALDPGEEETCTFTNRDTAVFLPDAFIKVVKQTKPDGSTQRFTFTSSYYGDETFELADDDIDLSGPLRPFADGGIMHSVSEDVPTGWDLTSAVCSGTNTIDAIKLEPNETVTCTFTNTQRGEIIVEKQTIPAGTLGDFTFTGDAMGTPISHGDMITVSDLLPGVYTSTEADPTPGFDLTEISCDDDTSSSPSRVDLTSRTATFDVDPGETVKCTFTNTQRGMVMVIKTSSGQLAAGFTFEIRTGASQSSAGDILASGTTNALGVADFGGLKLVPGTYQLCETGMLPGWSNDIVGFTPDGATSEGGDNSTECVDFMLGAGETTKFNVNNVPPPGGDARTIGFWKNWTSCDGRGNQEAILDQNLPVMLGVDNPYIVGIDACEIAVDLLDKRKVGNEALVRDGEKSASDPIYNMVAQLIAAKLNINANAGTCMGLLDPIIDAADALLDEVGFDGNQDYKKGRDKLSRSQRTEANELAGTLDDYNNNRLCN